MTNFKNYNLIIQVRAKKKRVKGDRLPPSLGFLDGSKIQIFGSKNIRNEMNKFILRPSYQQYKTTYLHDLTRNYLYSLEEKNLGI